MIELVSAQHVLDIRHVVLRPNQARSACHYYPEDDLTSTCHFAIKSADTYIACASLYLERHKEIKADKAYRIRGMATLPGHQSQGLGSQLLQHCFRQVKNCGGDYIWCNARTTAAKFYQKGSMLVYGDEFELPGIGPHYLMYKKFT